MSILIVRFQGRAGCSCVKDCSISLLRYLGKLDSRTLLLENRHVSIHKHPEGFLENLDTSRCNRVQRTKSSL